jgi:serine/threonine protein kinase
MELIGTRLGTLEITALIGRGGMGEVYRARDVKLKREVAVKILPEEFSLDPDRIARFQREAEVLASLNHPNIGAIYDLQEAGGTRFLMLELVEGETLADRISRGPIPMQEALDLAKHICDALEAAHEKGLIHRDLKPANIKVTPQGKVKVLDFGLAKAKLRSTSPIRRRSSVEACQASFSVRLPICPPSRREDEWSINALTSSRSVAFCMKCLWAGGYLGAKTWRRSWAAF